MGKQNYEWFVKPLNEETNSSFGQELGEENAHRGLLDNKGQPHNVYQCTWDLLEYFWRSRSSKLDFDVFNRTTNGQSRNKIRRVPFHVIRQMCTKERKIPEKIAG